MSGVLIYMGALLFLLTQYMYKYAVFLNIHRIHMTVNISTNNNVFFFVLDWKIVYYNNY